MASISIKKEINTRYITALNQLKTTSVKVGWFPSSRYDDKNKTPVAYIAAQNEYGNPRKYIPPRPFLRPAISKNNSKWIAQGKQGIQAVLKNNFSLNSVLENLGSLITGDIQASIKSVYTPVLAKRTIEARLARRRHKNRLTYNQALGISKPLEDTGYMLATVSYEIESA